MFKYLIYDTETYNRNNLSNTINIHDHYPFLITYVVADEHLDNVAQGVVKLGTDDETLFKNYLQQCQTIVGANIKYDIHMLLNYGYSENYFKDKNYIDIQVLARLVINHDKQTESFEVGLKKLAVKYLGIDSNTEEQILKREYQKLVLQHKQEMKQYFIDKGIYPKDITNIKSSILMNNIYTNWYKVYHVYPEFKKARTEFLLKYPYPSYKDVANVYTYALTDAILTWKLFKLWYPKVIELYQTPALIRTSKATYPLVNMERTGMTVDMKAVIRDRQILLRELNKTKIISPITGKEISADQNEVLRQIYEYETGEVIDNADEKTRERIKDKSPTAVIVSYKKKILKYLNGYVTRMLENCTLVNGEYKLYTQYKMSGTITGRLSSDVQQFPKEPLELETGEIIDIRSWFTVPKGYKYMLYFDYSQLELRLQCEWSYLVDGTPDTNMTRAFMPYKCIKKGDRYYLEEDPSKEWEPTDLHAMTAKLAFPNITKEDPEWSHYRKLGKRCNFA